ncbi:MAG: SAM-dependent DNA methyltransferase [Bacteroidales bacterium]|nr:MAG: SAM-dependent DNA methyltransferase [Bacteroidales bacterium]
MSKIKFEQINQYYKKVKSANKELPKKEAFKDLLNRLYANDKDIEQLIDKITLGSETSVLNIPRKDKLHRGSADTLYNKIIIEFENSLKVSGVHAKEQLAGYLLGQFKSGEGYNFTLIASDLIEWKIYAPDISCLDKLDTLNEHELILNEIEKSSFTLKEHNAEDFYYWIDRFLFKEESQKATLKRIEEAFGYQSPVFIESFRELNTWFNDAKKFGEVQVSYEQWRKFLSIAYGSFDASENNFLIHTYLSVFSKMLAYAVISNDDYIDDEELHKILDGSIFHNYNINNFVDNDFFHWVKSSHTFKNLRKAFRLIAQEISTFDFTDVDEDILKGVYQELIDLDTRHSLGEYYTPDWLCQRIVNEFEFKSTDKILDPSCGSGSFLRAIIHKIRENNPKIEAAEINSMVYGIDIHPLSVQIAKTTLLLALGKDIIKSKKPVHLNIILANTLLAPEGVKNLWGSQFTMPIDKEKYILNTQVFEDAKLFDDALDICEDLADQTMNKKSTSKDDFTNIFVNQNNKKGLSPQLIDSFYEIYKGFRTVKEKGRDSIWKFIVQNLYKPYFLSNQFSYIIGNPPWFTYSSIKNEEYQDVLDKLAAKYEVKPVKVADYPNLEIAAIFLAYCNNYFLKEGGKLAFVLPRSFFSGSQHDNTRSGKVKGFKLTNIWDLDGVSPLFRIPSCVLFSEKAHLKRQLPASGLQGVSFTGNLPAHNCNYLAAQPKLTEIQLTWFYAKQGRATAFSTNKQKKQTVGNPYKELFKRGAEITPRNFYFVELTQEKPIDWEDRIINIKTSDAIKPDAKKPWKGLDLDGRVESRFIFRTALSKSILPFALFKPDLVVLPVAISINQQGLKTAMLLSIDKLLNSGFLNSSRWFRNVENIWFGHRTEKNEKISAIDYLNWHNKLIVQNLNANYLIIYNASAKDANATVINRSDYDLEFFVDTTSYAFYTNNEKEAYYLAAILNSTAPNELMKDFQAKGLFGARHVHKKILDVYFPKFDENDSNHLQLAQLSQTAHEKASKYLQDNPPQQELSAIHLGRLRSVIKKHLVKEMEEIDKIVKKII